MSKQLAGLGILVVFVLLEIAIWLSTDNSVAGKFGATAFVVALLFVCIGGCLALAAEGDKGDGR